MRIIAGLAKGRNIAAVASATRPTSDRAREALFSTLASEFGDFAGLHILELYAEIVHAVEKDEQAQKSITANFESIKTALCPGSFHLFGMSVHRFLQDRATVPYHFIYIDPPYDVEDIDVIENLIQLREGGFLHPQALIAVERNSRVKEISWPDGYQALREKNYGQATIFYGVPAEL